MPSAMGSILRAATRKEGGPLNVLTCPTHERYESNLCLTGHNFYAYRDKTVKDWKTTYAPLPPNYVLLNPARGESQLPPDVDFDLVLSQNKFGQFQLLAGLARRLHLPLLSLEHTLPHPSWGEAELASLRGMAGHANAFISEYSRRAWGWKEGDAEVVHHGVDADVFSPANHLKKPHVLSVVNDLRNRDWCCGYLFWEEATRGLPRLHLGSSPDGWSKPARDVSDLVDHYRRAAVFVDTASASPIPSVVLEAMACGAVVVSRGNAMVPEVIEDGVNGFIRPDASDMRRLLADVLADPPRYAAVGEAARRTVVERFSLEAFVRNWDALLRRAAGITFKG